jgi:O-antigen/teichoic acid export membrane protein
LSETASNPGAGAAVRRFLGGSSLQLGAAGGARGAALLAAPLLTRTIGPDGYGAFALVTATSAIAGVVGLFGLDVAYLRHASTGDETHRARVEAFCFRTSLGAATLAGVAAGLFASEAGRAHAPFGSAWVFGALVAVSTVLASQNGLALMRGYARGAYRRVALATLLTGLLGTAANCAGALSFRRGEWALVGGYAVGTLAAFVAVGLPARAYLRPSGFDAAARWRIVRTGLPVLFTAPAYAIVTQADRWFLDRFVTQSAVGIYNFSCQFGMLVGLVTNAFGAMLLAELNRARAESDEAFLRLAPALLDRTLVVCGAALAGVGLVGSAVVRVIAAPAFHSGAPVVPLIACACAAYGVAQYGTHVLVVRDRTHLLPFVWAAVVAVCIGSNAVLVARFGVTGAATAQAIALAAAAVATLALARRHVPFTARNRAGLAAVAVVAAMATQMGEPLAAGAWADLLLRLATFTALALAAGGVFLWLRRRSAQTAAEVALR